MKLDHRFVEYIPKELDDGVLYVSIRFKTAVHMCACGCGNRTVTPLSPTDWKLIFNGKFVSLYPSIGNWGFPCKSHYWIKENEIDWSIKWSDEEIIRGRERNKNRKKEYFGNKESIKYNTAPKNKKKPWWKLIWPF